MKYHVAFLLPDLRIGGAQRVILTLAKAFLQKGVRVDLLVGLAEGGLLSDVPDGVQLLPLCTQNPRFGRAGLALGMLIKLKKYIRKEKPDALLSTLTGTNLVAGIVKRFSTSSTRLVIREASRLANLRHNFYRLLMRHAYRWADVVVVLNSEMREEIQSELMVPLSRVIEIRNPVDHKRLEEKSLAPLPREFDVSVPYIVSVGRLAPPKDYITLVRAFSRVVKEHHAKLIILGDGPDRDSIDEEVQNLSIGDYVYLQGYDINPYRWMARSVLLVHSSRWEGYPNVIVEAQALGLSIVVTEYDSTVFSLVRAGDRVVPEGDVEALTSAISAALDENREAVRPGDLNINFDEKNIVEGREVIDKYLEVLLG